jgi:hypothetical protein
MKRFLVMHNSRRVPCSVCCIDESGPLNLKAALAKLAAKEKAAK